MNVRGSESSKRRAEWNSTAVTVVIILNYNRPGDTVGCVQSVLRSECDDFHVIVMDNGSADGDAVAIMEAVGGEVSMLRSNTNLGVAAAWNESISRARSRFNPKYIFLLNNDTEADPGVMRDLVQFMDSHPEAGAASPTIVTFEPPFHLQFEHQRLHTTPVVDCQLSGCALMVRATTFDKLGMFDEDFFVYSEETDLLHRMMGSQYRPYYVPTRGRVRHKGASTSSMTSGFEAYNRTRNLLIFAGKNLPRMELKHFLGRYFLKWLPRRILEDMSRPRSGVLLWGRIMGVASGLILFQRARTERFLSKSPAPRPRPDNAVIQWLD